MLVSLKKITYIFIILVAIFSIISVVYAQESISNSISSINLSAFPISPGNGDSVTLTLSSDSLDLDSSKIIWYIDGVAKKETTNKSITIKTKVDGQKTSIRVVVETSDGIIKEVLKEISPVGVDLVVEPVSYSMPFYKGKPFFIKEGTVKIIAMPDITQNGAKVPSKNLNFRWSKDNIVLGSNSGKGQNIIIINSTIPVRDINIGVEILDDTGAIVAEKSKIILLNEPKILFYEDSPLYGVLFNKAIVGSYFLGDKEELRIVAKPFSFGFLQDTPAIASYSWSINDTNVAPIGKANDMILRQSGGGSGNAFVSLNLNNTDTIYQNTSDGFSVEFGK